MDDDLETDPQRQALEDVISILTPLRQHRQASAERAQRRAKMELESMTDHLSQTQSSLQQERSNQRERRQNLADAHLQKFLSLDDVDLWHDQERSMLDRLAYMQQDVQKQHLRIDEQQAQLEQAQLEAKASQRAVEKLSCLSEALKEEG